MAFAQPWVFPARRDEYEGLPKFADLPQYAYAKGQLACPECYAPVSRNQEDGRCGNCLNSPIILEVNYRREKVVTDED